MKISFFMLCACFLSLIGILVGFTSAYCYDSDDMNCDSSSNISCSIDVFGLEVITIDDVIRARIKNTGDGRQFITYTIYINSNDISTGNLWLNESETYIIENNYTFEAGRYEIRFEAYSDCGAKDEETIIHIVLEPFTCRNPIGYEGQRRCDIQKRQYLVCKNGEWIVISEDSGEYCYYCPHCGDRSCNCGESVETCYEDCKLCEIYRCYECQEMYLDQYRCRGNWLQRLYRYSNCETEWQDWEYCNYGCEKNSCKVPCGVSIISFDYNDKLRIGETGRFTITFKNTGYNEESINLKLFIDNSLKRSFVKNLFPGEKYTKTFEYALTKGIHKLKILASADCNETDSIEVNVLVFERESKIIVPPIQPKEGEKETYETYVRFHPIYLDIELGESKVLYVYIKTKFPQIFEFEIYGLEDGWVSYEKERWVENDEKIFIYITPKRSGSFRFLVSVKAKKENLVWNETINGYTSIPKQYKFGIPFCENRSCWKKIITIGIISTLIIILFLTVLTLSTRLKSEKVEKNKKFTPN